MIQSIMVYVVSYYLPLLLGEGSGSHVMFNGVVTQPISIWRVVRQGCMVSPLLFTIMTDHILVKLHNIGMEEKLIGLRLSSRKPFKLSQMTISCFWHLIGKILVRQEKCENC